MEQILICEAAVDRIIDLRWRLLRAGLAREAACFEGDDEPTTHHLAAIQTGAVVGCVTILQRAFEDKAAWQLRGMAVEPQLQRQGIGRRLVEAVERVVRESGHSNRLWCNARTPAVEFYRKLGWRTIGNEFSIPTAGPHFRMCKHLDG